MKSTAVVAVVAVAITVAVAVEEAGAEAGVEVVMEDEEVVEEVGALDPPLDLIQYARNVESRVISRVVAPASRCCSCTDYTITGFQFINE
jgi:NAD(P)H-dependent flavin oxidoreductase YrpB (nitropropane dioxygenase family)